jgi:DNA-binding transcriptional ArsR family regulator
MLSPTQQSILAVISEFEALTQNEIAANTGLDQSTISRNLKRLESLGRVKSRENLGTHQRSWFIVDLAGLLDGSELNASTILTELNDSAQIVASLALLMPTLQEIVERLDFLSKAINSGLIERRSDSPPVAKEKRAGKEKQEDPFGVKRLYMPNHMKWINAYEAKDIDLLSRYVGSFAWWMKQEGNREKWLSYKHGEEQLLTSEWFIANNGNLSNALFINGADYSSRNLNPESQPAFYIAAAREYIEKQFND